MFQAFQGEREMLFFKASRQQAYVEVTPEERHLTECAGYLLTFFLWSVFIPQQLTLQLLFKIPNVPSSKMIKAPRLEGGRA